MTYNFFRAHVYLLLLSLLFVANGCIHSSKKNFTADQQTQEILNSIQHTNDGLKTFKGIGSVKLSGNNQESSFRLAWAGENPSNLRLIVLISGKKIESFAANETGFFLKSHTGAHKFIKQNSSNTSLKKLISIPVKTNEIISLLSGKIPLARYKYARTIKSPADKSYSLELSKPWRGIVERVFLDNEKNITGFEMVKNGNVLYSVTLSEFKKINNFMIPFMVFIESEKATCKIKYSNYFANPDVDPTMFSLLPD